MKNSYVHFVSVGVNCTCSMEE